MRRSACHGPAAPPESRNRLKASGAMCGIVGYFGANAVDLTHAARSILHRGPDMQGMASGAGWRVAFNRLSILDTSENGMQPFKYDGVSVVMNGEIYNYRELKEEHKSEFVCRSGSDVEI